MLLFSTSQSRKPPNQNIWDWCHTVPLGNKWSWVETISMIIDHGHSNPFYGWVNLDPKCYIFLESWYKIQFNGHDKNATCHKCYMSHVTNVTCHKYKVAKNFTKDPLCYIFLECCYKIQFNGHVKNGWISLFQHYFFPTPKNVGNLKYIFNFIKIMPFVSFFQHGKYCWKFEIKYI